MSPQWRGRSFLAAPVAVGALATVVLALSERERHEAAPRVGFNNNTVSQGLATPEEAAGLIADAGGEVDRVQINWATLEPRRGVRNFAPYDEIYEADLSVGIQPLFIFAYAPVWANGGVCDPSDVGANCLNPPTPEHYDDAARTAAAIARRYPKAIGIEIWNEPNTAYFWPPRADPQAYARLLAACHGEIKRVAPEMTVAGASTSNSAALSPGYVRDDDFLRALLAEGGGDAMDAISVHLYPDPGDLEGGSAINSLRRVEAVTAASRKPLWVTETGLSTTGTVPLSEAQQAQGLETLLESFAEEERIEMLLVHTLIGRPSAPGDPETGFGIVAADGTPLEAYCMISAALGGQVQC